MGPQLGKAYPRHVHVCTTWGSCSLEESLVQPRPLTTLPSRPHSVPAIYRGCFSWKDVIVANFFVSWARWQINVHLVQLVWSAVPLVQFILRPGV